MPLPLLITLIVLGVLIISVLITAYVCFYIVFYSPKRKRENNTEEYPIPEGKMYQLFRDQMIEWMDGSKTIPHKDVEIISFDGLTLRGKYYEHFKGAPLEILFHGYRGDSYRDLSGGIARCYDLGHNALVVDHRGAGRSDGSVISFGAKESRDCAAWVDFAINNIDKDVKIIITGISMGAATVMIASAMELPKTVIGVLADCGYTSCKDIIKKVMKEDMNLPADLLYPFVHLGGLLFGKFDSRKASPIDAMKSCKLPVIFIHGDYDKFVPHQMSVDNYNACASSYKKLVTIEGAGHGLCFPVNMKQYKDELKAFFAPLLKK